MEEKKVPLTMENLTERIIQLENRIEATEEKEVFVDETPDLFDVEELSSSEIDNELKTMEERISRLEDSTNIVLELERIREEKSKSNKSLRTMNATCITRMVLEAMAILILSVLIVSCSLDFKGQDITPEKLDDTAWSCIPTVMDGMEVMKIVFDENGIDGYIYFMTRGEVKTRSFTTSGNEIQLEAPAATWLFYTDYETYFIVECGDDEVEFTRFVKESNNPLKD